ncbi:hypothetical protein [Olsenella profusa]|uniref:Polysaccharide biosynthesis protein n=1 Tax=Olsenella profusa TaxID=138595 RepID=A0ABS2F1Q7_9ACTN|nr:hypothetical protein [Olsenella profusa]MBM6774916.1 hypothetical protein [Olsenella profusa]
MYSQLKAGAAISYAAVAFNTLAGLLYTPWMISCIGSDDYGLYTLAISVVNFFLLDFGLGDAVSRFMSKYYAEGRDELVAGFLGIVFKVYLIITAAIAIVLLIIYINIDAIYAGLGPHQLQVFRGLYLIVALYSLFSFPFSPLSGILTAKERFVALNLCNLAQKVGTVALIVVALLLGWGVYALVAVNALVSVAVTLVKLFIVSKWTDVTVNVGSWDSGTAGQVIGFSVWVTVSQICQRLIFSIMPSIIAMTSSTIEVTLFGLASSLEGYVYTVAAALNGMFMPKVSRSLAGEDEGLQSLMIRIGRIQLYIIGFIFVCFLAIGTRFVDCWMGEGYEPLWACTVLLILPSVFELPQLIGGTAITASGHVKEKSIVFIGMAACNIALGFVLTRFLGAFGGCVSICVAYFLRTLGENVLYKMKLGIDLSSFFIQTFLRWLAPAVITLTGGCVVSALLPVEGWAGFVICGVIAFLVYAMTCWMFAFDDYEKNLVKGLFARTQ